MSVQAKNAVLSSNHDLLRDLNDIAERPESSVQSLAKSIAGAIQEQPQVVLAAVLIKPKDLDQLMLAGYSSVKPLHITRPLHLSLSNDWLNNSKNTHLILSGDVEVQAVAKYLNWSVSQVHHNDQLLGLQSLYIVKLKARGHNVGLLAVGLNKTVGLDHPTITTIESAKGIIATLLGSLISEQENHQNIKRLKEYSNKLSALDIAKDDFISMASHQLRTPLTSIKGYISMILELDAGDINEEQKAMLTQAFASCQRMVYIISDLLNVSRLNTGKFVVELLPVNLDTVIRDEIGQLKEIAKSKQVTINYSSSPDIPNLNLDETKIRQVIMNFIDNALYYTPPGGQIEVILENKPASVELRVKDNGIGVPRSEQHHLFTKFYRASNARKARPDGTGLGLFMAKKMVIAMKGAIIFDSKEGRGSTFGFIFPKQ
ncbi:MAG TPA: HAMP domain-containing sensor histidine kinase [Candidatus Saccharimonadales bacterium]|nr:HAMP domain-containing sensor histidine kinase [Candidatus Saccharimonadales bacterium]